MSRAAPLGTGPGPWGLPGPSTAWAGTDGPALSQNEGPGPTGVGLGRAIKAHLCPQGPDKNGEGLH